MKLSKRKQTLAKEKEKEMVEKKHNLRKQLDTIVYPQTNHTSVYHDHSCFFFAWLKLILWKAFGFDSKKKEAK